MDGIIRRKLAMASRAREFCRAHQNPSEGFANALARLEDGVARAEALVAQQGKGFFTRSASTKAKAVVRRTIREDHLRHLVRIARGAESEVPELPKRFRLPANSVNGPTFLGLAQAMAAEAVLYKDLFIQRGMPATFVEDLKAVLADYEAAVNGQFRGLALHIGARAEMRAMVKELTAIVRQMDAVIRIVWAGNGELLGAWRAATDVVYPKPGSDDSAQQPAA